MKNDLKNFAQSILDGLDVVSKAKSAQQAVAEAERARDAARNDEAASRAVAAQRLQEADAHACAKIESAEREAEEMIHSAKEVTRVRYQAVQNDTLKAVQDIRAIEAEKDQLASDCARLRATISGLEKQKLQLDAAIKRIKDSLGA